MAGLHEIARAASLKDEQVSAVFDAILARTRNGEHVMIKGFGTFRTKRSESKIIKSSVLPDGEAVVPAYDRLTFKASVQTRTEVKPSGKAKGKAKAKPKAKAKATK